MKESKTQREREREREREMRRREKRTQFKMKSFLKTPFKKNYKQRECKCKIVVHRKI